MRSFAVQTIVQALDQAGALDNFWSKSGIYSLVAKIGVAIYQYKIHNPIGAAATPSFIIAGIIIAPLRADMYSTYLFISGNQFLTCVTIFHTGQMPLSRLAARTGVSGGAST
jgi:hypothetical protein